MRIQMALPARIGILEVDSHYCYKFCTSHALCEQDVYKDSFTSHILTYPPCYCQAQTALHLAAEVFRGLDHSQCKQALCKAKTRRQYAHS